MSTPYWSDDTITLYHADCLNVLADLPDNSIDAVCTDPPYGLGFMGQKWDTYADEIGRAPSARARFDHVGGNHNPSDSADAARTRRVEDRRYQAWCEQWAQDCLRVLKPGGFMLAFGGTRTWHRLAVAIEDAGFEIRDSIAWLYGSGFPKSLDVSKAIDKQRTEDHAPVDAVRSWLNARRIEAGYSHDAVNKHFGHASNGGGSSSAWMTNPTSRSLPSWDQWLMLKALFAFGDEMDVEVWRLNGRKGKPGDAFDSRAVIFTREVQDIRNGHGRAYGSAMYAGEDTGKIEHKTTAPATPAAQQWQGWGTALKPAFEPIVVARKPLAARTVAANVLAHGTGALNIDGCRVDANGERFGGGAAGSSGFVDGYAKGSGFVTSTTGRWPTNVVLDDTAAAELDEQSGNRPGGAFPGVQKTQPGGANGTMNSGWSGEVGPARAMGDTGGASRFFPVFRYEPKAPTVERPREGDAAHPTVKPLDLMRWLVRLVTPPGGTVLDPFAGSGTTAEACVIEGARCITIEREAAYLPLIVARLSKPIQPDLFGLGT